MALVHPLTQEVMKSELEAFALPPTQTSVEEVRYEKYHPQTSLDRGGEKSFLSYLYSANLISLHLNDIIL